MIKFFRLLWDYLSSGLNFFGDQALKKDPVPMVYSDSMWIMNYFQHKMRSEPRFFTSKIADMNYDSLRKFVNDDLMGENVLTMKYNNLMEEVFIISNIECLAMVVIYSKENPSGRTAVSITVLADVTLEESNAADSIARLAVVAHAASNEEPKPVPALD